MRQEIVVGIVGLVVVILGAAILGARKWLWDRRSRVARRFKRHGSGDDRTSVVAQVAAREVRTELRHILTIVDTKQAVVAAGHGAVSEPGFRFANSQWRKHRTTLAHEATVYESVAKAYGEVDRLNAELGWHEANHKKGTKTGFGPDHHLERLCKTSSTAIATLTGFLGEIPADQGVSTMRIAEPLLFPLGEETYEVRPLDDNALQVSFGVINSGSDDAAIDNVNVNAGAALKYGRVHAPPTIPKGAQATIRVDFDWGGERLLPGESLDVSIHYRGPGESDARLLRFVSAFLATGGWHIERREG